MAELLVSVRSVQEAEVALAGGAGLIDVKEPARGALGRADVHTIAAIVDAVAGRQPVSAALGELDDSALPSLPAGLAFVKWGLGGCREWADWPEKLRRAFEQVRTSAPSCRPVAVAYADWQRADAPEPAAVVRFAVAERAGAVLLDTWQKDGSTLLDWLSLPEVQRLCQACRQAHVRVALAGSLGVRQIRALTVFGPDWFAVRSAACAAGRRQRSICQRRVRRLVDLVGRLSGAQPAVVPLPLLR